ncbi:hypothetical protein THRCLA_05195 [Thraustotheca clavata]|uniref:Uncharacterized protein n=1 Tax=Thraustotheca clavata TaxID=74557 RepID=A0A1V9ZWT0_9STRA|nr:hypothetical protein THRCLA_05195 [Thraustotheca clavata]
MEVVTDIATASAPTASPTTKEKDFIYAGRRAFSVWMDWTEWLQVYRTIFANELKLASSRDEKLRALARIAAWKARSDVPVAIEATAHLAEISCHDQAFGLATPGRSMYRSHEELRLLYSAAILRCVNGLVDASQKGAYAMAISTLAMRIGIPLWVVDIRHEAAHTKLPALATLQLAAQTLWQWLFEHYWQPQETAINQRVERVCEALIRSLDTQLPLSQLMSLDLDTLSKILVPVLVSGSPYTLESQEINQDGGLLLNPAMEEAKMVALCKDLQSMWTSFDAVLIVALAKQLISQPNTIAMCTKWLFYFSHGNNWAHGDRFMDGLAQAFALLEQCDEPTIRPVYGTLKSIIDSTTVDARLNRQPPQPISTWTRCSTWTETPVGLCKPFENINMDLAFDDETDTLDAGHMILLNELPVAQDDVNVLASVEDAYFSRLNDIVDLDTAIANEIESAGKNSHNENVPQEEVERLQDAIEIW